MSKVSHKKTLIKTVSWRAVGTIDTFFVTWFITGDVSLGAEVGAVGILTKSFLYYIHERVWLRKVILNDKT